MKTRRVYRVEPVMNAVVRFLVLLLLAGIAIGGGLFIAIWKLLQIFG